MKILVTGGSGFIGTNLVEALLKAQIPVVNLDKQEPLNSAHKTYWRKADILNLTEMTREFRDFRPTHVVHLAGRTDLNESKNISAYAANHEGTENCLTAIDTTATVTRVVIASSMLVCRLGYVPKTDNDYMPNSLYGESKVKVENIVRRSQLRCPWVLVRPTTIWGPWSFRLKDGFFRMLRKGYYVHPGGDVCVRSYGYVGNCVQQIQKFLECPAQDVQGKTFYVSDANVNVKDFTDAFSKRLLGRPVRIVPRALLGVAARCGDVAVRIGIKSFPLTTCRLLNMTTDNVIDIQPTLAVTGAPKYTFSDGVERTAQWLESVGI